ncbi:MAG: hypothetical protein AAF514_07905 [Verrucomicrobiota bacterium]
MKRLPYCFLSAFVGFFSSEGRAAPLGDLSNHIHVDQFGYPPAVAKMAVLLADPQTGFNSGESAGVPSAELELPSIVDDAVVIPALLRPGRRGGD